jgi:hypothetical protein
VERSAAVTCQLLEVLFEGECVNILDDPPLPNTTSIRPALTADEPVLSTVTLNWMPPSESWQGLQPPFIAGYAIYVLEPMPGFFQVVERIQVDNPGVLTYVLDLPGPGSWGISVAAISTTGSESAFSNRVDIVID